MKTTHAMALFTMTTIACSMSGFANSAEAEEESYIESISVSGTRTAREINEIASSVTRITSEDITAISATNVRDMLRYEPGVSVEGNGRYGLSSFNIRGINGDRVLITLDGVPVADEFSFGPNLSSRRDFIDIDLIESLEIVRGPASTLYGSDAIGGVVAFTSKDPIDLLEDGQDLAVRFKSGYASQSNEWANSIMLAGGSTQWQWLLNASIRKGSETDSFYSSGTEFGAQRQQADPQDNETMSVLAKLIYQPNESHRVELSIDGLDQQSQTQLFSEQDVVSRGVLTSKSDGDDERERERISIDYVYQPQSADSSDHFKRFSLLGFYQQSQSTQITDTTRQSLTTFAQSARNRSSEFEQEVSGLNVQLDHEFSFGSNDESNSHYLIYGASIEKTDSIALREGTTVDIETGENIPEFSVFPARDFPPSTLTEYALYIQDEITLLQGALTLSPGIRYDKFKLDAQADTLFSNANPGVEVENFSDSEISAKLGAVYRFSDEVSVWYQYAEGFRIPPMDDINVGFTNFAGGYTSLPNPDLVPESVASNEIGLRIFTDAVEFSTSVYNNQYDNFIESLALKGFNPVTNLLEFQAINIDEVEITGVDIQAAWHLGKQFEQLQNWTFRASYSRQNSEDKSTGEELESILPSQTVVGLSYGDFDANWRAEMSVTHTAAANQANTEEITYFRADSHTLVDLTGHYQVTDNVRLSGGIFNVFDKEYYQASEVRGRTIDEDLSRYSSPGRNVSVNVVVNF